MQTKKETNKARYLRQEGTETEKILWEFLRKGKFGLKWRRQHPVDVFVLDFYAPSIRLAIELDGVQHGRDDAIEYDEMRTKFLESKGIKIMRFWNTEVENNLNNVLSKIENIISELLV